MDHPGPSRRPRGTARTRPAASRRRDAAAPIGAPGALQVGRLALGLGSRQGGRARRGRQTAANDGNVHRHHRAEARRACALREPGDAAGVLRQRAHDDGRRERSSANDILHISNNAATAEFFGGAPDATQGRLASTIGCDPRADRYVARRTTGECLETRRPVSFEYLHDRPGPAALGVGDRLLPRHRARHLSEILLRRARRDRTEGGRRGAPPRQGRRRKRRPAPRASSSPP